MCQGSLVMTRMSNSDSRSRIQSTANDHWKLQTCVSLCERKERLGGPTVFSVMEQLSEVRDHQHRVRTNDVRGNSAVRQMMSKESEVGTEGRRGTKPKSHS